MPRKEQRWITFQSSAQERQLLDDYCTHTQRSKTEVLRELVRTLESSPVGLDSPAHHAPEHTSDDMMQVSARNLISGRIKRLVLGPVSAEVTLEIAANVDLVAVITRASAERLTLEVGKEVYAVVKASNVMIAILPGSNISPLDGDAPERIL